MAPASRSFASRSINAMMSSLEDGSEALFEWKDAFVVIGPGEFDDKSAEAGDGCAGGDCGEAT